MARFAASEEEAERWRRWARRGSRLLWFTAGLSVAATLGLLLW